VRTVLLGRLGSVGETAGQILAAGSVIGRSFDLVTLRHASGRSEDETVDAIDECLRHGLIQEAAAGFDFAHGALRDLAYESMSLTRRRLLHRRVAEAMRLDLSGSGRDDLARLVLIASHERAAGRDADAADAYRQAGARAAEVFANDDAIAHLSAALALGHPDAGAIHATIGRLYTRVGDYAEAIAELEAAAALASTADLPELEWALARAHLRRGDLAAALHHLDAALGDGSDARLLAQILVDRSVVLRRMGEPARAAGDAARAAEAAERAGDPVAAGAAHRMLGLAALDTGDTSRATHELTVALEAAVIDPDPTARIAALSSLAMATAGAGSIDDALSYGDQAVADARAIGDRHLEAAVENGLADLLHAAGRDEDAMPHLRRAVEAFAEVGGDPADPDPGIWMLSAS
jgi:tetratricopeptide (TPR) repeat protein